MSPLHFTPARLDSESKSFFTAEGLDRMLTTIPKMPTLVPRAGYRKMSEPTRLIYDTARRAWLKGGLTCVTRQIVQANADLEAVFDRNSAAEQGDHEGLMYSGPAHAGKSTLLRSMMRRVQHDWEKEFPTYRHDGRVPIVYLVVSTSWTPKMLAAAFCRFFGMTVRPSETADDLFHRVMRMLNTANTQLVIIDEVHRLGASLTKAGHPMDMLKSMHDHCSATFLYAGVNLEHNELLSSDAGAQVSNRFPTTVLTQFNRSDNQDKADWRGIIEQFEAKLTLADQKAGSLVELADYFHDRTGGSLGSLAKLIIGGATNVVREQGSKPEMLTKSGLAQVRLGREADRHYAKRLGELAKMKGKAA